MNSSIQVWDLPTRLFHWSLVTAVFYSWFSIEVLEDMQQHFYSGYVVLTLLLFRLVWGFIGSHYARFNTLIFSSREILRYARSQWSLNSTRYLGHNPLGSLSVMLMLIALLTQAILGLFSTDDYFFGPLTGLVESGTMSLASELHLINKNIVFACIGLHVVAIIYYKLSKKEALTKAMVTGKKNLSNSLQYADKHDTKPANTLLALIVLFMCIAVVYWLATAYLELLPTSSESYY